MHLSRQPFRGLSRVALSLAAVFVLVPSVGMGADDDFANFESAQVHPIAVSADSTRLFAVNTPDGRLSIFDIGGDGSLELSAEIAVGIEPVSLAVRGDEVWVVNHISDSISVIDVPREMLVATIQTGDEPTDIVFANGRAFVSMAGGRDQVKVYDAVTRVEVGQLDVFGDDPRAMAVSLDESEVYLVVLESGNGTMAVHASRVLDSVPPPSPAMTPTLPPAPDTALIVQYNPLTDMFEDETGQGWIDPTEAVLPDDDIFVIDTATLTLVRTIKRVGTTLFDIAVRPGSGDLWIANTDAHNAVRFEPNLRGGFVDTRLTVVDAATENLDHFDLNPHIDYGVTPGPPAEIAQSVAIPGDIEWSADGSTCYVAAFGSANVGVINVASGTIDRITVGGGPSGLALAEDIDRLYVANRFDNSISIVNTASRQEVARTGVAGPSAFDPSPAAIREGRPFLYNATETSGHGDVACASCHVFANFDGLGWDLGDPVGSVSYYSQMDWLVFTSGPSLRRWFHPMKGPMVTQTLRGLEGMEPFHWRGDRRDFQHFNGAFVSLMGRDEPLPKVDMDRFTDFIMTVRMPPNPNRTLDDRLPATISVPMVSGFGAFVDTDPSRGEDIFFNGLDSNRDKNCVDCHAMPNGTDNTLNSTILDPQDAKIAQLRNVYEKVGFLRENFGSFGNSGPLQQKAGFGVLHHGASSLTEFLVAYFLGKPATIPQEVASFLMAFPSGTPPIVGHQLTVDHVNALSPYSDGEISLMLDQAEIGNCDLVVRGVVEGQARSFAYDVSSNSFVPDSRLEEPLDDGALRALLVDGDVITYTAVPLGSGVRIGIDRDRDTWRDADELLDGADPADVDSTPLECQGRSSDTIEAAQLKLKVDTGALERIAVTARGKVQLAGNLTPPLDINATGMILDIRSQSGAIVLRRWIPPEEWTQRKTTTWRFRDKQGTKAGGIQRAVVRNESGEFAFSVKGRVSDVSVAGPDLPLTMIALLGTAEQDALNQCGRREFELGQCRHSGSITNCR